MGQWNLHAAGALLALGFLLAACQGGGTASPTANSTATTPAKQPVASAAELPPYKQIQPRQVNVTGPYTPQWSGMTLAEDVGEFRRLRVVAFDEEETDVSGVYSLELPEGKVLVNSYVYPWGGAGCDTEFVAVKQNIRDRLPDATLVAETNETVPGLGTGWMAVYDATGDILGSTMALRTEGHLFCGVQGPWLVKYRISYPRGANAEAAIKAFIAASPSRAVP